MKINIITFLFIFIVASVSFVFGDVFVGEGTELTPTLSNVTYISSAGGFFCSYLTVDDYCLNVTGGTYEGQYCYNSTTPTNITIGSTILHLNIYDEQTLLYINNTNVTIKVVRDNDNITTIYNTTDTGILLSNYTSSGNHTIYFDADGYHPREYYVDLKPAGLNTINLYLLNDSTSVSDRVTLTVFDQDGDFAKDVIVKLQRNYVNSEQSIFITVSMATTNFEGQAKLYVEMYDVFYKLIYEKQDGTIIEVTDPTPFLTTTPTEQVNLVEDPYLSFREYDNVQYNLTFVNSSGVYYARFFYSDNSNLVREGCLSVKRITARDMYDVCYNCTTSSSATISCYIDTGLEGQFKAVGLIDTNTANSFYPLSTLFFEGLEDVTYGQEAVFFAAIQIGTMVLMGIGSITGSILLLIVGFIAMIAAGFIAHFSLGYIYWLIMAAGIVMFIVSSSKKQ